MHAFMFLPRVGRGWLQSIWFGADCPRDLQVQKDPKAGHLVEHELDVICFVKRHAADQCLAQEMGPASELIVFRYAGSSACGSVSAHGPADA